MLESGKSTEGTQGKSKTKTKTKTFAFSFSCSVLHFAFALPSLRSLHQLSSSSFPRPSSSSSSSLPYSKHYIDCLSNSFPFPFSFSVLFLLHDPPTVPLAKHRGSPYYTRTTGPKKASVPFSFVRSFVRLVNQSIQVSLVYMYINTTIPVPIPLCTSVSMSMIYSSSSASHRRTYVPFPSRFGKPSLFGELALGRRIGRTDGQHSLI